MINFLCGTIKAIDERHLTVMVSGVGFDVQVPDTSGCVIGKDIELHIYAHWSPEQGPTLFGFTSALSKKIFIQCISCSGIGPKIGLAILEQFSPGDFVKVIQTSDEKALSKINGIGAKKAEQMVVQLRHKVAQLMQDGACVEVDDDLAQWKKIADVLTSLGYSRAEIALALGHLRESGGAVSQFDHLIRNALSFLAKRA